MREPTLRERWLNGEDVIYDPILDVVIDEMQGCVARFDDETRAMFCCLSDKARGAYLLRLMLTMRDKMEHDLLYGVGT